MARNIFNSISVRKPSRNRFPMSHDVKLSLDMGKLVPISILECIPGDSWNLSAQSLIRFAPLIAPVMHSINVHIHWFFVPNRILWSNWEDLISPPKADSVPPAFPTLNTINQANAPIGSLADYMGLPVRSGSYEIGAGEISALPFAAYQKIYNEYYRDQNLINEIDISLSNGGQGNANTGRLLQLRTRAWMHDYFTAALPFAQKGAAVNLPLGDYLPVSANTDHITDLLSWEAGLTPNPGTENIAVSNQEFGDVRDNRLYVDLAGSESPTINTLRVAMRTQEFLERQARGGSRYVEQIRSHFGVRSSDKRLNRPEFIGGTSNPVVISEVLQTSSSDDTTPQATMAGHGIAGSSGRNFRYFAEEHGYIIGIMSITPKTAYQQGIPRHFSRKDMYDYAWPTFAHIGEQEILNKELYHGDNAADEETFGYVPRYAEYRYMPSRVAGAFRDSLSFWHLGRIFQNRPLLNQQFIECDPRNDIFAVSETDEQNIWAHVFNKVSVSRLLPKYGTPTL